MEQFTKEELKNISVLIQNSQIKGAEAVTVAILLQKIERLLNQQTGPTSKETKTK